MTVDSSPVKFIPPVPGESVLNVQTTGSDPAGELEFKPGMAINSLRELPVRWDEP